MKNRLYPGLGLIGCERLSGIYGVNEGIVDGKGTGVQHLFFDAFGDDLIHTACTLIKIGDAVYYGNRHETRKGHQNHLKPIRSELVQGFAMTDVFDLGGLVKEDCAFGFEASKLGFETKLVNQASDDLTVEVYAYVVFRNSADIRAMLEGDCARVQMGNCQVRIAAESNASASGLKSYAVSESPTGFLYRTTNAVLYNEKKSQDIETKTFLGLLIGGVHTLSAHSSVTFQWGMVFADDAKTLEEECAGYQVENGFDRAKVYWDAYIKKGHPHRLKLESNPHAADALEIENMVRANLIAIKSATNGGFVPADLTGHYFSDGSPSFYARDAMMTARAFLLSGHDAEFESIMRYLMSRLRKTSGEFYQRYNGWGNPSEGANNNVFHQLDSIGYFMSNLWAYYRKTGICLATYETISALLNPLLASQRKYGMLGPEGGVNEGVYGPAFITSSNMFIYGGLKCAAELLETCFSSVFAAENLAATLRQMNAEIFQGIESTYLEGEGYQYGYVDYHEDLVKKYDTPVYFGCLYGFEYTENMQRTHECLLENAAYFQDGIGYSEQEYHHGPWIFNTAACAEYAYSIGDIKTYTQKYRWIVAHSNAYGLFPEAIYADDESQCFINPLVWACAEFVSASFIEHTCFLKASKSADKNLTSREEVRP